MIKNQSVRFELIRWSIFLILILTYIFVYFHRMAPAVVSNDLTAAFGTSGATLGTLAAIYFFVYAAMQIPSGVLSDTLGTRTAIIAGNLLAGMGSILFGLAETFAIACMGRFIVGVGVSVVFVSIMKNNSIWFSERIFGFMSGLTLLIGNLGSIMATAPLAALLTVCSWRVTFIGIGVVSIGLAVLGFFFVRNRPEDFGLSSLQEMEGKQPTTKRKQHWAKDLAAVVKTIDIWPGFWVQLGITGGIYAFMGLWGVPYLQNTFDLSREQAALYMTDMLLAFALGSLFFGWFSDRLGRRKPVLLVGVLLYIAALLVIIFIPWTPGPVGFILFGMLGFLGSVFVITFACAKETIDPNLAGMSVSIVNTGAFIGTTIIQPLFGWVLDLGWDGTMAGEVRMYSAANYHNALFVLLVFAVIGLLGALRVRETYCTNRVPEISPRQ
jgi:sugar phosphate permease